MLNYSSTYPGQVDADAAYPQGKARNVVTAGDGTGTPLEKGWVNDVFGFFQALVKNAAVTPSGSSETADTSDLYDSLVALVTSKVLKVFPYHIVDAPRNYQFSTDAEGTVLRHVWLGDSGAKMYTTDQTGGVGTIFQYTLSTAWDLSSAAYASKSKNVSSETTGPRATVFKSNGLKMYVLADNERVYQYSLSTAWDVSTATYDSVSLDTSGQVTIAQTMTISADGSHLYVACSSSDTIYRYALSTAWDLSTATYASDSLPLGSESIVPVGVDISSDGKEVFIVDSTTQQLFQYHLGTANDLSSSIFRYRKSAALSDGEGFSGGIVFGDAGRRLYAVRASSNDYVEEYLSNRVAQVAIGV